MTSERHIDVISILPSYAPGSGALVPPRAHLADDCGVLSLDGMWSFAYHGSDPAPFVNVEQPWDEPSVGDDADTIDVPSHWVLRGEGAWVTPPTPTSTSPSRSTRPSRPTTIRSATTVAPSSSLQTGRVATFACASTASKAKPPCG